MLFPETVLVKYAWPSTVHSFDGTDWDLGCGHILTP